MSTKHKRPFVVFAAVAAICCMVLVTGVRSKADGSHTPDVFSATVETAGPPISPLPEPTVTSTPDPAPKTDADSGRATNGGPTSPASGEFEVPPPDTGPARGDREPDSGRIVVPPLPVPPGPGPVDADPGDADELRPSDDDGGKSVKERKKRGQAGFNGKRGNENDEADDESDDETAARDGHPTQPQSLDEDLDDQDEVDVEAEDQP